MIARECLQVRRRVRENFSLSLVYDSPLRIFLFFRVNHLHIIIIVLYRLIFIIYLLCNHHDTLFYFLKLFLLIPYYVEMVPVHGLFLGTFSQYQKSSHLSKWSELMMMKNSHTFTHRRTLKSRWAILFYAQVTLKRNFSSQ